MECPTFAIRVLVSQICDKEIILVLDNKLINTTKTIQTVKISSFKDDKSKLNYRLTRYYQRKISKTDERSYKRGLFKVV